MIPPERHGRLAVAGSGNRDGMGIAKDSADRVHLASEARMLGTHGLLVGGRFGGFAGGDGGDAGE